SRSTVQHQAQSLPLGILEVEMPTSVSLDGLAMGHTVLLESSGPVREVVAGLHAQARKGDVVVSPALSRHGPIEELYVVAGTSHLVRVEEVIRPHVVLVDGALHEPHSKHLREEALVLFDSGGDGSEVVEARQAAQHELIVALRTWAPRRADGRGRRASL